MSIFERLLGKARQSPSASVETDSRKQQTSTGFVTDCRLWNCPKCGELLEKAGLGTVWKPSEPITGVNGTGTCSKCGAEFPQSDIYGGHFDVKTSVPSARATEQFREMSIVVFRIRSYQPPSDAKLYCRQVLTQKHPDATMDSHYIVGFADDLSTDEAVALYRDFVRKGQLPHLGRHVDALKGSGPGGDSIVALFFAR